MVTARRITNFYVRIRINTISSKIQTSKIGKNLTMLEKYHPVCMAHLFLFPRTLHLSISREGRGVGTLE